MSLNNRGPGRPQAVVVGGDRRTQMLAHVLLTELGYTVGVAATLATLPPTTSPERVRALVVVRANIRTAMTRLIVGLRQRGYCAPLVVLCYGASQRLRQRAFQLGAADVISLPAPEHEVAVRLRVALAASADGGHARLRVVRPDT
jgi:DNA-binding response OmpR family regulator